jgi:hypothetical protein
VFSALASQAEAEAGTDNTKGMSPLRVKQSVDANSRAAIEAASDSNVFTDADHTKLNGIAASANNYTHPNHSGEITSTGDGATVIASNVVDEDNLKVSNSPSDGYILTARSGNTGGMTWEAAAGGGASDIDGLTDGYANKRSVGLGSNALANLADSYKDNTALGFESLNQITTGANNVAVGKNAGKYQYNTLSNGIFIGANAGPQLINTGSSMCIMMGTYTGQNGGCDNSVLIGHNLCNQTGAGSFHSVVINSSGASGQHLSGNYACHIGFQAGGNVTTGQHNTMLGYSAGSAQTTSTNVMALGSGATPSSVTVSNEITLGNSNISTLRCQVQTISSLSDKRDKKDIEELPLGIDFINTLKPVKFTWNMRDGAKIGQQEAGFIAQDLDEAQIYAGAEDYLSLVLKNNPEKLEASYGKLVPVLVKAVQELSAEVATLKKEIENGK